MEEIGVEDMDWINLAQGKDKAVVKSVIYLQVL
jgi:hypothetical protein